jgi:LPXTG-motif cell wall-anchored protein
MTFDQWLAFAGLAGTIIGILLAIYFYFRSRRKVRLSYQ